MVAPFFADFMTARGKRSEASTVKRYGRMREYWRDGSAQSDQGAPEPLPVLVVWLFLSDGEFLQQATIYSDGLTRPSIPHAPHHHDPLRLDPPSRVSQPSDPAVHPTNRRIRNRRPHLPTPPAVVRLFQSRRGPLVGPHWELDPRYTVRLNHGTPGRGYPTQKST